MQKTNNANPQDFFGVLCGDPIAALPKSLRTQQYLRNCRSCSCKVGDYSVEKETWGAAKIDPKAGSVCLNCLDLRLIYHRQKPLCRDDFPVVAENHLLIFALGPMIERMSKPFRIRDRQSVKNN